MNPNSTPQQQSKFQKLWFDADYQLLHLEWYNTQYLTEEGFKAEILWQLEQVLHYQPSRFLFNTQNFIFTISPELQDWANQEINNRINNYASRIAFVISRDMFSQMSIEQQMEDNPAASQALQYFDNVESALHWLRS